MELSRRIRGITGGGSDGWDIYYKARAMKAAGAPVIELTLGEHDIKTDPEILQAMDRAARAGLTGYAAIPGAPEMRAAVAARMAARTGVPTGPENVLVTPGGQAALFAAFHATCDEGDVALICDPHYATYPGTARAVGAVPRRIRCRPEAAFRPSEGEILAQAQGARVLLVNSPNNPTGVVYDRATLDGIARAVTGADLWLISDEVYDTLVWDGVHISLRSLPGMAERTLVVGSMSKSHAMTGSRIGWVAGPAEAIDRLRILSTHTTYTVPGFIQAAAVHALSLGEAFEARVAEPFRRRRALAERLIAGQNVVRLIPSGGAMYLMLDIRATGLSGEGFAHALLDREGIAVMPGESFGQAAAGHVRVAMTVADDAFVAAVDRLIGFARARARSDGP